MPPRRKAKKGVKRTEEDKKKEDFVDEEAERQAAAIRAIRDVEIEHTLTALDLLCSYFTEQQIQTPVLGFFKDNLPDLSIARDEESGEIELKWNDLDGVDVNDSILKRLSMGFPDLYNNSRPSLGGYNNVGGSMLGTGNTHLQNLGTSTSQMLASHDALRTPVREMKGTSLWFRNLSFIFSVLE
ncbi:hypothetical protein F2Q70_00027225 [Brassica cretica]|uniref:Uncharacterized protein n=1 Tax=Brassica cretica TaxID=69181 RepID=A0A8S9L5V6_BRACR|nr:hypothetical protein F2Q70_00027225 [Brassica cretica]